MSHYHLSDESACRLNAIRTTAAAASALIDPTGRAPVGYELRFRSLFDPACGYAFPCDAGGHVDLDSLSERARERYFYARALVGRDYSVPGVEFATVH